MELNIIVLAKQVPDTRNVGSQAMNPDGTINRSALPAIFNPEDLNALEQALIIKEKNPGSRITLLTMGPVRAADILREGLYRGADAGILLTDRAFAGADTLATSYALTSAIRKIGKFDIILCGRQAIDGDTAQVGPQVAQQLGGGIYLGAAVQAGICSHLVIAGAGGVQLGTGSAYAAGQLAFDVHVHIFELHAPLEIAGLDVGENFLQPVGNGIELLLREHAGFQLGACMRRRTCNIMLIELPIGAGNCGFGILESVLVNEGYVGNILLAACRARIDGNE